MRREQPENPNLVCTRLGGFPTCYIRSVRPRTIRCLFNSIHTKRSDNLARYHRETVLIEANTAQPKFPEANRMRAAVLDSIFPTQNEVKHHGSIWVYLPYCERKERMGSIEEAR